MNPYFRRIARVPEPATLKPPRLLFRPAPGTFDQMASGFIDQPVSTPAEAPSTRSRTVIAAEMPAKTVAPANAPNTPRRPDQPHRREEIFNSMPPVATLLPPSVPHPPENVAMGQAKAVKDIPDSRLPANRNVAMGQAKAVKDIPDSRLPANRNDSFPKPRPAQVLEPAAVDDGSITGENFPNVDPSVSITPPRRDSGGASEARTRRQTGTPKPSARKDPRFPAMAPAPTALPRKGLGNSIDNRKATEVVIRSLEVRVTSPQPAPVTQRVIVVPPATAPAAISRSFPTFGMPQSY
jgi:hypothetical protein